MFVKNFIVRYVAISYFAATCRAFFRRSPSRARNNAVDSASAWRSRFSSIFRRRARSEDTPVNEADSAVARLKSFENVVTLAGVCSTCRCCCSNTFRDNVCDRRGSSEVVSPRGLVRTSLLGSSTSLLGLIAGATEINSSPS